jgi:hypothetical protein
MPRVALERQRIDKLIDIPELKKYDMRVFDSVDDMRSTISNAISQCVQRYEECTPSGHIVLSYCECGSSLAGEKRHVRFLGFKHEIGNKAVMFGWEGILYVTARRRNESKITMYVNYLLVSALKKSITWQTDLLQKLSKKGN